MLFFVNINAADARRTQCTLNKELHVSGVVYHVDILITKFVNNAMNTITFHANTCSYGVNAVVKAFNSNLSSLTRKACNATNGNQSVADFGHLHLQKAFQEHGTCARKDNLWIIIFVVNT